MTLIAWPLNEKHRKKVGGKKIAIGVQNIELKSLWDIMEMAYIYRYKA